MLAIPRVIQGGPKCQLECQSQHARHQAVLLPPDMVAWLTDTEYCFVSENDQSILVPIQLEAHVVRDAPALIARKSRRLGTKKASAPEERM